MDKKKVFGAIVGIIAFIALIAGATYAWLVNTLGVNNGTYNLKTMNFMINYTQGTAINNDVPILATATASTAKNLAVTAALAANSAPGKITIYLNTTAVDNALLNGPIKYSYCVGTCSGTAFADHTQTLTSSGQIAVISNQTLTTSVTTFNIYFWLDGAQIGEDQVGKTYSGYISAIATQTE